MKRKLVVEFTKMEGAGNDFIVLDNRFYHFTTDELAALAIQFCDRRRGIGADGLLALSEPDGAGHDFRMRYHNADGSLGTMCGNGARCLVAFAIDAGFERSVAFGSDAGDLWGKETDFPATDLARDIEVSLPDPTLFRTHDLPTTDRADGLAPIGFVWTGTEHLVYQVTTGLDSTPVDDIGPLLRRHPLLGPTGANVNFVEPLARNETPPGLSGAARVRTYEKGVEAETLACGTGAAAVAVCGREVGWWGEGVVEISMRGGVLRITIKRDHRGQQHLSLSGPTRVVFRGTVELDATTIVPASAETGAGYR